MQASHRTKINSIQFTTVQKACASSNFQEIARFEACNISIFWKKMKINPTVFPPFCFQSFTLCCSIYRGVGSTSFSSLKSQETAAIFISKAFKIEIWDWDSSVFKSNFHFQSLPWSSLKLFQFRTSLNLSFPRSSKAVLKHYCSCIQEVDVGRFHIKLWYQSIPLFMLIILASLISWFGDVFIV